MKKILLTTLIISILLFQFISATSVLDAKQNWLDSKQASLDAQQAYRDAKSNYLIDKTTANEQVMIDFGKDTLNAALDEVEAWLNWKKVETESNNEIPSDLEQTILEDIQSNMNKIDVLRIDVDGINTQFELGIVFLTMVGKYFELLSDVAKDNGLIWVYIAEQRVDTIETYEANLRTVAQGNNAVISKLDSAKLYINEAKIEIANAETSYNSVVYPGTPLIKFAEGNNHLRATRLKLINAVQEIKSAHGMLI